MTLFSGKIRIHFIAVLLTTAMSGAYSQNLVSTQKGNEEIFLARTKQLNEFIDRFNLKSDFRGNSPDSAFLSKMPREKMLAALFDLKDTRTITGSRNYSRKYINTQKDFIDNVSKEKLMLNRFSPGIIAEAIAKVTYKGQPATVRLFLNQEAAGKGGVKWVLLNARGNIFNLFSKDTTIVRFIPPSSNETDFINLGRALEDTDHLPDYASADFSPDHLSTFFFCLRTGLIKYEYVEKVVYHILDIPGWYLRVEDFNRNELNSGWLISDLAKNELDRNEFLKKL
ncbi:MAG: hypothetical protein ACM3UT_11205 [Chloroflexota bacterium]